MAKLTKEEIHARVDQCRAIMKEVYEACSDQDGNWHCAASIRVTECQGPDVSEVYGFEAFAGCSSFIQKWLMRMMQKAGVPVIKLDAGGLSDITKKKMPPSAHLN